MFRVGEVPTILNIRIVLFRRYVSIGFMKFSKVLLHLRRRFLPKHKIGEILRCLSHVEDLRVIAFFKGRGQIFSYLTSY